jgi:putative oxidoreductase
MDTGVLLARVVLGSLMAAHGAQKLFGWFGGYGIAATGGFFESLGFRPGRFFATAAGFSEIAGGVLLALGLLGPLGPALIVSVMVVAMGAVHWQNGVFAAKDGIEVPLLYVVSSIALATTGFGAYSLDAVLALSWPPAVVWGAITLGILGGAANLAIRKTTPAAQHV